MSGMIEKLYDGELHPFSYYGIVLQSLRDSEKAAFQAYDRFLAKLPAELKEEFIRLIDDFQSLCPLEMEENFIDGFRIGVQLTAEAFLHP